MGGLLLLGGFGFELGLPLCQSQGHLGVLAPGERRLGVQGLFWRRAGFTVRKEDKDHSLLVPVVLSPPAAT